ncbi:hypothetical protein ACFL6P_06970 [Candidatus Latescibacterota bacterium]
MSKIKVRPSRWYYVIAGLVLGAGLAGFGWLSISGISSLNGALIQVVVPGQRELILSETGSYTIFHEYRSVVGNKVYSMEPGDLSDLQCSLRFKATEEEIPLSPLPQNSYYTIGGSRSGVSAFNFLVDSPGIYVLSAQYTPGKEGPEGILSIGHGFLKQIFEIVLGCLGIGFGTLGAAVAIAVPTFLKRRRAFKLLGQVAVSTTAEPSTSLSYKTDLDKSMPLDTAIYRYRAKEFLRLVEEQRKDDK